MKIYVLQETKDGFAEQPVLFSSQAEAHTELIRLVNTHFHEADYKIDQCFNISRYKTVEECLARQSQDNPYAPYRCTTWALDLPKRKSFWQRFEDFITGRIKPWLGHGQSSFNRLKLRYSFFAGSYI